MTALVRRTAVVLVLLSLASCREPAAPRDETPARVVIVPFAVAFTGPAYSFQFSATVYNAAGDSLVPQPRILWSSSDTTVVAVGSDGRAVTLNYGEAFVRARIASDSTGPAGTANVSVVGSDAAAKNAVNRRVWRETEPGTVGASRRSSKILDERRRTMP